MSDPTIPRTVGRVKCPPNWRPFCRCSAWGTEPSATCPIHGRPDNRLCPCCHHFKSPKRACASCGFSWGDGSEGEPSA